MIFISDPTYPTQEETPVDRELQATELARIMSADPLIFLGYVITDPHAKRREYLHALTNDQELHLAATNVCFPAAPYEIMVTDGRVHDIDKDDTGRWCEYIFYRGLHRTAYARISRGSVTDTGLQVGQFSIPSYAGSTRGEEEMSEASLPAWVEGRSPERTCAYFLQLHHHPVRSRSLCFWSALPRPQVVP